MPPDQPDIPPSRHNLPVPRTSFIGREQATADVRRLLGGARLLTLTGAGGSGKTRVALCVAQETLANYPGGVWWVDLAPLTDPDLLPQTIAAVLGLREQSHRSFTALLQDDLRQRSALLILDNCEHLRRACADFLEILFAADCAAHVLATSREPLGVMGERVWMVPLLALPDLADSSRLHDFQQIEAVRLFVERARAVASSWALDERNREAVAHICLRLDGLPLAIELAAARMNVLTPQQIAARLDNSGRLLTREAPASDARQTLRAAMDWSFDLLTASEQMLFRRLAVFAGSFTLEAVEDVCAGEGLERDDLLDLLACLVEKSLVVTAEQSEEMRYRLLEPIRQYAVTRLHAEDAEASWRERHAAFFLALVERAKLELHGSDQGLWLDRLEREHDNARAALAWCATNARNETGLRLASVLHRFWLMRGYLSEGQRWTSNFLARVDEAIAPELRVAALLGSAALYKGQSNFTAARTLYEQSLTLTYHAEYEEGIETALSGLGATLWELGDYPAARSTLEEAVELSRSAQHPHALAGALVNLALVHHYQSDTARARAYYEEALEIDQGRGNRSGMAITLFNLATLAGQSGDYVAARLRFAEVLATNRQLGDRSRVADALINFAELSADLGDFAAAEEAFAEAEQIYHEISNVGDLGYIYAGRGDIAFGRGQYGRARAHYHEALSLFRGAGNRRLIGRSLGGLGHVALREGNLAEAAELYAQSLKLRRDIGHKAGMIFALDGGYLELALAMSRATVATRLLGAIDEARQALTRPRKPTEARACEVIRNTLQAQLGDETFTILWNEGRAMSLEQAAAYALDSLSPATVAQPLPELRIFALGPVRVYCGDRLLTSADWTYAKARELVLYLLCHKRATREQIGAELWPDATSAQVRQRFSAALAHARNALGREADWIILADGYYSFNRARPYWFDVDAFHIGLREARRLLQGGANDDRAAGLIEEAVNLYGNDFAYDVLDGEWHGARREALRQAYLEALLDLGRLHARARRDEQAVATYRRVLAQDAYLEDAHHELIRAFARLDKRRQAFQQYETLKAALLELDLTPSLETTTLIERLRRGHTL